MSRRGVMILGLIGLAGLLMANVYLDVPFRAGVVTVDHTNLGVSQLLAGELGDEDYPLHLFNPTQHTMIASVQVYTSPRLDQPGDVGDFENSGGPVGPEKYLGCLNLRLTPHGSVRLSSGFFTDQLAPNNGETILNPFATNLIPRPAINQFAERMYVEVVSVPETAFGTANYWYYSPPIIRDGDQLGLAHANRAGGDSNTWLTLLNPALFNFAENSVVPGQREDQIDCMCEAADAIGDRRLWDAFGIPDCPPR